MIFVFFVIRFFKSSISIFSLLSIRYITAFIPNQRNGSTSDPQLYDGTNISSPRCVNIILLFSNCGHFRANSLLYRQNFNILTGLNPLFLKNIRFFFILIIIFDHLFKSSSNSDFMDSSKLFFSFLIDRMFLNLMFKG